MSHDSKVLKFVFYHLAIFLCHIITDNGFSKEAEKFEYVFVCLTSAIKYQKNETRVLQ